MSQAIFDAWVNNDEQMLHNLITATELGSDMFEFLLEKDAADLLDILIDKGMQVGLEHFIKAVKGGKKNIANTLMKRVAINNENVNKALVVAVKQNDTPMVKVLCANSTNLSDYTGSLIVGATAPIVRLLLQHEISDPNARMGMAMQKAVDNMQGDIVQELLRDRRTKINLKWVTAAANKGDMKTVKAFVNDERVNLQVIKGELLRIATTTENKQLYNFVNEYKKAPRSVAVPHFSFRSRMKNIAKDLPIAGLGAPSRKPQQKEATVVVKSATARPTSHSDLVEQLKLKLNK